VSTDSDIEGGDSSGDETSDEDAESGRLEAHKLKHYYEFNLLPRPIAGKKICVKVGPRLFQFCVRSNNLIYEYLASRNDDKLHIK